MLFQLTQRITFEGRVQFGVLVRDEKMYLCLLVIKRFYEKAKLIFLETVTCSRLSICGSEIRVCRLGNWHPRHPCGLGLETTSPSPGGTTDQ